MPAGSCHAVFAATELKLVECSLEKKYPCQIKGNGAWNVKAAKRCKLFYEHLFASCNGEGTIIR